LIAVAFTGPSNSGKTTIIEKISQILISQNKRVLIIKNDPKDKAIFDIVGKDSYKFFTLGADVYVLSPTRTTNFKHSTTDLNILLEKEKNYYDYFIVEGLKHLNLPRIGVFRTQLNLDYFGFIHAIAIDSSINLEKYTIPVEINILNLNDPTDIITWIDKNGMRL